MFFWVTNQLQNNFFGYIGYKIFLIYKIFKIYIIYNLIFNPLKPLFGFADELLLCVPYRYPFFYISTVNFFGLNKSDDP